MLRSSLFAVVILGCVAVAQAQEGRPEPAPVDAQVYEMVPLCGQVDRQARFFPRRAVERGVGGEAAIDCALNEDGSLRTCQVARESPQGYGFGEAAVRIACRIPATAFGVANANNTPYEDETGQRRIRRTVRFNIADDPPPQPHGSITN